jgi:hypothetical protein
VFFWVNFAVFDIVGKFKFSKIKLWDLKKVTIGSWGCLVGDQPQNFLTPHSLGSMRL